MKEPLADYELSKLFKEVGFDWETINGYYLKEKKEVCCYHFGEYGDTEKFDWNNKQHRHGPYCSRPTLSHAAMWLREAHNIHVYVPINGYGYYWKSYGMKNSIADNTAPDYFNSHDQALSSGIKHACEIIKQRSKST